MSSNWETFRDDSYYHMWRLRRKNERKWDDGFHINSKEDAEVLCELLNKLEEQVENLKASGIHTCHDQCQRPMCVMRRERDKARQQRDRITTIARELIAMIRINVMVGRFAECTVEQIDEHLKPWIDKIAAVKGGSDE